jgi:LuxR family maltose regulon positive regulatory protein
MVAPRLTQCRVLLAQREADNHRKASEWLDRHLQLAQATHNIPQTISILTLKALACKKLDDPHQAEALLLRALTLARPGGWIRPFVALGPEMRSLFGGLGRSALAGSEIDTIIAAIDAENKHPAGTVHTPNKPAPPAASRQSHLPPPLTSREIDILDLLKKRLTNQEIADTLFISPETVKRHLYNIYKKLSVKNRREASAKIAALDIQP